MPVCAFVRLRRSAELASFSIVYSRFTADLQRPSSGAGMVSPKRIVVDGTQAKVLGQQMVAHLTNEFRTLESHSAEYFGDTRDYWWHPDYIELIGRRLAFDRVHDVLDVGCGVG